MDEPFEHAVRLVKALLFTGAEPVAAPTRVRGGGSVRCPVTICVLRVDEARIDHAAPDSFETILRDYVEEYGLPAVEYVGTRDVFVDPGEAVRWRAYHDGGRGCGRCTGGRTCPSRGAPAYSSVF